MIEQTQRENRRAQLINSLSPRQLLPSVTTGIVIGILIINSQISYGALIFSGDLSPYMARGIGFTLFGACVIGLLTALMATIPCTIARPQDSPAVLLALSATAIAAHLPVVSGSDHAFNTVVTLMIFTSLLTGIFFFFIGKAGLGNWVRFIPYPVIGGFLAGIGWLVVKGAMRTLTGTPLTLDTMTSFLGTDVLVKWVPGCLLAVLLMVASHRYVHFLTIPLILLTTISLFYLFLFLSETSVAEARMQGWLLGTFSNDSLWKPLQVSAFFQADWGLIARQWGNIASIMLVSITSFLLSATGVELATRQEIDLNHELRTMGIANVMAGMGGSHVGFHSTSRTVLAHKMGANTRVTGIVSALLAGLALTFGASVLSYFPKFVVGGSLLFLGFGLLFDWVYKERLKLPRRDYLFLLVILVAVSFLGFLRGVVGGLIVSTILFVIDYGNVMVIKNSLSGATYRSNFDRSPDHEKVLEAKGDVITIFKLQGFLFFGTANSLFTTVKQRMIDTSLPTLRYVVFDFRQVNGLDSSAVYSFMKLRQYAEQHQVTLVLTDVAGELRQLFVQQGFLHNRTLALRRFQDLDHGLEWCENDLLEHEQVELGEVCYTLAARLTEAEIEPDNIPRILTYFEKHEVDAGYYVIHQGDSANDIYYLETGLAVARLDLEDGKSLRFRTLGPGTFTGEIGMYRRNTRSASVVTERASVFYRLSRDALDRMAEEYPASALKFQEILIRILAERLAGNSKIIRTLLE